MTPPPKPPPSMLSADPDALAARAAACVKFTEEPPSDFDEEGTDWISAFEMSCRASPCISATLAEMVQAAIGAEMRDVAREAERRLVERVRVLPVEALARAIEADREEHDKLRGDRDHAEAVRAAILAALAPP